MTAYRFSWLYNFSLQVYVKIDLAIAFLMDLGLLTIFFWFKDKVKILYVYISPWTERVYFED